MENLIQIHNRGKFHNYHICGCQVINFQMFSWQWSIHELAHFGERGGGGGVLGPNSLKHGGILMKFAPKVAFKQ